MEEPNPFKNRNINTEGGHYNERIEGDYIQGNILKQITNIFIGRKYSSELANSRDRVQQIQLNQVSTEVESRINSSLHNRVYVVLEAEQNPSQVECPWDMEVKIGSKPKVRLKDTEIITVFDQPDIDGRLLILGQPGAGKTTILLKLAFDLIKRAKQDPTHPIPVLFSLSSWKNNNQSIKDWLVNQLKDKYGVRKDIGNKWVDNQEIIPLLDGLDELAAEYQEQCVKKINDFLHTGWSNPLVVCSRQEEYQQYATLLQLNSSLELYPFTIEQVYQYLENTGNLQLWGSISNDTYLNQLAKTPLLLNIIVLSAEEISQETWQQMKSSEERLSYLFEVYIHRMLKRPYKDKKQPKQENTKRWLGWLAQRLIDENASEFLIERLQPYWLQTENQIFVYNFLVGEILLTLFRWVNILSNVEYLGLTLGLIIGQISGKILIDEQIEKIRRFLNYLDQYNMFIGGLSYLISAEIPSKLLSDFQLISDFYLIKGLIFGWILGLMLELNGSTIQSFEKFNFSFNFFSTALVSDLKSGLKTGLKLGIISVIILALLALIIVVLNSYYGLISHVLNRYNKLMLLWILALIIITIIFLGLCIGLFFGLVHGLIDGLISGFLKQELENKTVPNQGVRQSVINSVIIALICSFSFILFLLIIRFVLFSLLILLIFILHYQNNLNNNLEKYLFPNLESTLFLVRSLTIIIGIYVGNSAIGHLVLRVILWSNGCVPWNYAKFLNYCTNRLFLQRVGGSYRFMHDLLRQHFANSYAQNEKRYEEALTSFDKAIQLNSKPAWAWAQQGRSLLKLERYEEALTSFNKAIQLDSTYAWTWGQQGWLLLKLERYEEALTSFNKAIQLDSKDAWTWGQQGRSLLKLERYEEALTSFNKAIQLDSKDAWAWGQQGWLLLKLERYEEALTSLNKAIQLDSKDAWALYNLACSYAMQGNIELTIDNLRRAIELNTNCKESAKTDPDFANIREHELFKNLVDK
ncbi:tetratricopeptide repeat protein [Brasilonema sp. UFV-L1]|uniref:tetratricopeptide repeat protein n=1 Tax=Brasilonema sp. UFV-L1 TaxID=2234130 RepID=UPI00145D4563|nr:tetratricopeptide repeat protein [Brasilonema sp. UFV-L1]NMG11337.1 hypothetical protein [Brasilonema sp. UFV-L1]